MVNISNLDWSKVTVLQCEAESVVNSKYGHYDKGLRSVPVFAKPGVLLKVPTPLLRRERRRIC